MARKPPTEPPGPGGRITVRVQQATRAARAPSLARLSGWAQAAAGRKGRGRIVTLRLVGYPESRRLNEAYRGKVGKGGPTNVLAFPAGTTPAGAETELGDLVICLPLAYREAREQGKQPFDHLAHLVVHGTLHLLGHDHEKQAEARKMELAEVRILRTLGIGNPYQERTSARAGAQARRTT